MGNFNKSGAMQFGFIVFLFTFFVLCAGKTFPNPVDFKTPIIDTIYGKVQGRSKYHQGIKYDEFLGIPFAKPPVGELRFGKPSEPVPWDGILEATSYSKRCVQLSSSEEEDCLYINIVVPFGILELTKTLPVVVFVHGGAFLVGSSNGYPGQGLAITAGVVVVTFNYRLGPIGFFSLADENAPGNYGVWDSRAALIWTKKNIAAFQGDSEKITLMGQSAGGMIVGHLMLSPLTNNLFKRAITMSGTCSAIYAFINDNRGLGKDFSALLSCQLNTTQAVVSCLRRKNPKVLHIAGYVAALLFRGSIPTWIPSKDNELIKSSPREIWKKEETGSQFDYIIGRAHHDGAGFVLVNSQGRPNSNLNLAASKWLLDLVIVVVLRPLGDSIKLLSALKQVFPGLSSDDLITRTQTASQIITDYVFASPAYFEAQRHYR